MKKVSQSDVKKLEKSGATVRRRTPKAKKDAAPLAKKEAISPTKEVVQHASMGASMEAHAADQEATRILLAQNAAMIKEFSDNLKNMVTREPSPYTFDVVRNEDDRIKRVYARPGILEEEA
jgi:hypothetical protein